VAIRPPAQRLKGQGIVDLGAGEGGAIGRRQHRDIIQLRYRSRDADPFLRGLAGFDQLQARFNANAYSGRIEGGYRFVSPWVNVGITPYAAA
jgi:hypothetical protein